MTPWQNSVTKLTRRMAEDMALRDMAEATIDAFTDHVGRFATFLGKPLKEASAEDIRSFATMHGLDYIRPASRTCTVWTNLNLDRGKKYAPDQ